MNKKITPVHITKNISKFSAGLLLSFLLLFPAPVYPRPPLTISSSPNPVGSGARALGMGGAFIGVADDATAASWNPGGLVQLKTPEMSVVFSGVHRSEDIAFASNPEADGINRIREREINYLSLVYPFHLFDRNMIVSLNYQNLYDFSREWDFSLRFRDFQEIPGMGSIELLTDESVTYQRDGNLTALGLAYCIQIIPQLSFGVTLNIWDDDLSENSWETVFRTEGSNTSSFPGFPPVVSHFSNVNIDEYSFSGWNANIGLRWQLSEKLKIGFVLKTPFTADLRHTNRVQAFQDGQEVIKVETGSDEELTMPWSFGFGAAWRFSDRFTLSTDIYASFWDDFMLKDANGVKTSPITGKDESKSDVDATCQIRLGAEYLWIHPEKDLLIPLRAGIFYDPAPSEGSPDDYYGFSLGSGIAMGRYIFDLAYQYRFGNDVGSSMIPDYDFSQDVEEHMIYTSLIIHF